MLCYYPKKVRENIVKRKHYNTERVFRGIHAPTRDAGSKAKAKKNEKEVSVLERMKQLSQF